MSRRPRALAAALSVALTLCLARVADAEDVIVMTSGAFTAAYLELGPTCERSTKNRFITAATTMGTGATAIPARLARGEAADVVIVAADALDDLIRRRLVAAGSRVDLARSNIGMAVRSGSPKPDISTIEGLTRALLQARSVAYSASVSGDYLVQELFPRLGVAEQLKSKSRRIEGERVGAVVARGDAEIGFQQISELLPIPGIDIVGPLPAAAQRVTTFAAGVAAHSQHVDAARALVTCLASPIAADVITKSGMEPARGR